MRVHGFIRAMAERGIEIEPNAIVESDFSATGGYAAASQPLRHREADRRFSPCNDMMGIGALRAAAERRISVPRDCSIIGFDDIELSRYTYPALSTVGQSVRALGEMAAQTLIDRIAGKLAGTTRRVAWSCAAPDLCANRPRWSRRRDSRSAARFRRPDGAQARNGTSSAIGATSGSAAPPEPPPVAAHRLPACNPH